MSWAHFKFKEFIQSKAIMMGKEVVHVTEEYTTQCCGGCGMLNKVGGSTVYVCKSCGFTMDRDFNGARNIFLKHLV